MYKMCKKIFCFLLVTIITVINPLSYQTSADDHSKYVKKIVAKATHVRSNEVGVSKECLFKNQDIEYHTKDTLISKNNNTEKHIKDHNLEFTLAPEDIENGTEKTKLLQNLFGVDIVKASSREEDRYDGTLSVYVVLKVEYTIKTYDKEDYVDITKVSGSTNINSTTAVVVTSNECTIGQTGYKTNGKLQEKKTTKKLSNYSHSWSYIPADSWKPVSLALSGSVTSLVGANQTVKMRRRTSTWKLEIVNNIIGA